MIKDILFNNSRGEKIVGTLKEKNKSDTILLVCHGLNASKNHPANVAINDKLYDMGHTTYSFNFSKSASGFNIIEQIADIKDTVNYFHNYKKIIIMAVSLGAVVSAIATILIPNIKGLVTINGFFGKAQLGRNVLKKYIPFRIMAFLKISHHEEWEFFKANFKPEKITVNTLVIHAKKDEEVFVSQSKDFFKKLSGKKQLYILEQGDHHLTKEGSRQEVAFAIDKWLNKL